MRRNAFRYWLAFLLVCGSLLQGQEAYMGLQERVGEIYESNKGAVIRVFAVYNQQVQEEAEEEAEPAEKPSAAAAAPKPIDERVSEKGRSLLFVGTGYLISKEGHVLTNTNVTHAHLANPILSKPADRVWVNYKGVDYIAETLGGDQRTNVSLLRVPTLPTGFQFLRLPDSDEPPPIGSFLIALTCELGMEPGPSLGILKGYNVNYGEAVLPTVYMRTEIPSDGGEGGSPVFDLSGRMVGMMVAALPDIRSSFVLPSKAVKKIRDDIIFSGKVEYALFGLSTEIINNREKGQRVSVSKVFPDTPAAESGLQAGDILLAIGEYAIKTNEDMKRATFFARPNEVLTIKLLRDEEPLTLTLKTGELSVPPAQPEE